MYIYSKRGRERGREVERGRERGRGRGRGRERARETNTRRERESEREREGGGGGERKREGEGGRGRGRGREGRREVGSNWQIRSWATGWRQTVGLVRGNDCRGGRHPSGRRPSTDRRLGIGRSVDPVDRTWAAPSREGGMRRGAAGGRVRRHVHTHMPPTKIPSLSCIYRV